MIYMVMEIVLCIIIENKLLMMTFSFLDFPLSIQLGYTFFISHLVYKETALFRQQILILWYV
jgi:hypothetical protein